MQPFRHEAFAQPDWTLLPTESGWQDTRLVAQVNPVRHLVKNGRETSGVRSSLRRYTFHFIVQVQFGQL